MASSEMPTVEEELVSNLNNLYELDGEADNLAYGRFKIIT